MENPQALDPVEFDELADLFVKLGVFASPSELHGLLCGQLAGSDRLDEKTWLVGATVFLEQAQLETDAAKTLLLDLFATTREQLMSTGFELLMLLPDDDADIGVRAQSLGRWCAGFVAGFGEARAALSEDARETLEDLEKIAQIDETELEADEENEQDLMQLAEYVRMAAIMLFSECQRPQGGEASGSKQPSLH